MWKTVTVLICAVLILLALGLVMVYSSSATSAEALYGKSDHFILRQAIWASVGLVSMVLFSRIDYHRWRWLAVPTVLVVAVLLVLVRVPGIGQEIKGSWRWIRIGPISLQPSEFAKFATVLFLAWWLQRVRRKAGTFTQGFLFPGLVLGVLVLLVFFEPDFGTALLLAMIGGSVLLYGGTSLRFLLPTAGLGLGLFSVAVMLDEERMGRVLAFLDPEKYESSDAWQLVNALYGFVVGGLRGAGLGESLQKRYYLPEAHTDFIFAIIGEELGLVGTMGILVLFLVLFVCGLWISMRAPDYFGRMLAFGATVAIVLQALINMAVVTGSCPTTGMSLPFISYGGSSLLVFLSMVGLLVNIAMHVGDPDPDADTQTVKNQLHEI
jgi:cell division protein FtsW